MDQAQQSGILQHLQNDPIAQRLIEDLKKAGQSIDLNAILMAANQKALEKLGVDASTQTIEIFIFSYIIQKLGEQVQGLEASHPAHKCFWKLAQHFFDNLFKSHTATTTSPAKDTFVSGSDYHNQG